TRSEMPFVKKFIVVHAIFERETQPTWYSPFVILQSSRLARRDLFPLRFCIPCKGGSLLDKVLLPLFLNLSQVAEHGLKTLEFDDDFCTHQCTVSSMSAFNCSSDIS